MSNIIAAAITNADAIHPGYGFEIQNFLKSVKNTESNLLVLLQMIDRMGDKAG
jgi:acetyl/propionyl-CoA carboxylase alpha subunit